MTKILGLAKRLSKDEKGAALIEYPSCSECCWFSHRHDWPRRQLDQYQMVRAYLLPEQFRRLLVLLFRAQR